MRFVVLRGAVLRRVMDQRRPEPLMGRFDMRAGQSKGAFGIMRLKRINNRLMLAAVATKRITVQRY